MTTVDGFEIPLAGGGFGAYKTGTFVLNGVYVPADGIKAPFIEKPLFLTTDSGYGAVFDEATRIIKIKKDGALVTETGVDLTGVKVLVITKGI